MLKGEKEEEMQNVEKLDLKRDGNDIFFIYGHDITNSQVTDLQLH